jgi:hypothetical protein
MIASRVLTAVLLSAEWNLAQPPRRIVGPPIYSGLFGPDRDIWPRLRRWPTSPAATPTAPGPNDRPNP